MSIIKKIESIIQEIGYDYVLDGNSIIVKSPAVSFQDENTCIQVFGGACPITPDLVPDINRANRYFEKRNAAFQYGKWKIYNGNSRVLVQIIPSTGFNSLSKDDAKELIYGFIIEFSNENKAVILDLMSGKI